MANTIERNKVVQYCLNQGTGITYVTASDFNVDTCETTPLEIQEAAKRNVSPRYVKNEVIDWFCSCPRRYQVIETINNNYDLCDFDEWTALQNILGIEMSRKSSDKINGVLWESYDVSPMNMPIVDYEALKQQFEGRFVSEREILNTIFGVQLRDEDYIKISRVFIDDLGVSLRMLFVNRMGLEFKVVGY